MTSSRLSWKRTSSRISTWTIWGKSCWWIRSLSHWTHAPTRHHRNLQLCKQQRQRQRRPRVALNAISRTGQVNLWRPKTRAFAARATLSQQSVLLFHFYSSLSYLNINYDSYFWMLRLRWLRPPGRSSTALWCHFPSSSCSTAHRRPRMETRAAMVVRLTLSSTTCCTIRSTRSPTIRTCPAMAK